MTEFTDEFIAEQLKIDIKKRNYMDILAAANLCPNALREIQRLNARLADYEADRRKVLDEQCASDEQHCACVPELRTEVERLNAYIKRILDDDTRAWRCEACGAEFTADHVAADPTECIECGGNARPLNIILKEEIERMKAEIAEHRAHVGKLMSRNDELRKEIERLKAERQWISVEKEGQPVKQGWYQVHSPELKEGNVWESCFIDLGGGPKWCTAYKITHWMSLPDAPKDGEA